MNWGKLVYQFSETKWNLYLSFFTDLSIGLGLIAFVFLTYNISVVEGLLWLLFGWFTFTLIEYMVHAWLFHIGKNTFVAGHAKHHRKPQGYDNLPFFGASIIVGSVYILAVQFFSVPHATLFVAAIFLGYVAYTIYHFLMHRIDFKNFYGKYMQRFHYVHHMRPKKNHGVTTPIWDIVFGTYEPLSKYTFDADLKVRPAENLIKGE